MKHPDTDGPWSETAMLKATNDSLKEAVEEAEQNRKRAATRTTNLVLLAMLGGCIIG